MAVSNAPGTILPNLVASVHPATLLLRREDGIRYVASRCNDTDCHR